MSCRPCLSRATASQRHVDRILAALASVQPDPVTSCIELPWFGPHRIPGVQAGHPKLGRVRLDGEHVNVYGHRLILELKIGRRLRPGEFACHICDNPRCVNAAHLVVGDAMWNSQDMIRKGRAAWQAFSIARRAALLRKAA